MPPTQNPQNNNQPYVPSSGQPPAQPQQPVAAPMMEPFDQHTNMTQPVSPPVQQQPQQPLPSPLQPSGAQPLRPYGQQFEQKEVVDDNPYDFFLNPSDGKKSKNSKIGSNGSIGMGKIILVVGAMVAVIGIAAAVLISSTKGADPSPALTAIATQQQEIIHVTTAAATILESGSLQNFAATAQYGTTSAQLQYVDFLNKIGIKLEAKDLAAIKFSEVDQVLSAAQTASTYDVTFKSQMQTTLTDYLNKLKQSRAASQTKAQSDILDKNIAAAIFLQQQLGT